MLFRQMIDPESWTFTYLLADLKSGEAVIIDSVKEQVDRDIKLLSDLGLKLKYAIETHVHADHVSGAAELRKKTGSKIVYGSRSGVQGADLLLEDGETVGFGPYSLQAIHTPGHTEGCVSYRIGDKIFTGDTLFIRGTGRTDFQGGSAEGLYDNIRNKLFTLPDETLVYPGHNYIGLTVTTIGEEKRLNPRVGLHVSREESVKMMFQQSQRPKPKKFDIAVPANLKCGDI